MKQSHEVRCHCGAVRIDARVDLAAGTSRCNCSVCTAGRFWKVIVQPEDFRLQAGEDAIVEYRFGAGRIRHRFCRHCGIKTHGYGEWDGAKFYAINVAAIPALTPAVLASIPVAYENGREDDWDHAPPEQAYL